MASCSDSSRPGITRKRGCLLAVGRLRFRSRRRDTAGWLTYLAVPRVRVRTITEVHHAGINNSLQLRFSEIDAVWRELFVVGTKVCRWKSNLFASIIAANNGSQNRVFAAKHLRRLCEIACFDGFTNRRAAYQFAIDSHWWNSHDPEIEACAELIKQFEIAAPIFSKRPFVSHANFAQRLRMLH